MHLHAALCLAALGTACSTAPSSQTLTHPAATILGSTSLAERPFGVAAAWSGGRVLVARLDAGDVHQAVLPDTLLATPVTVGSVPTNLVLADSRLAFVTNQADGSVGTIDLRAGEQIRTLPLGASTYNLALAGPGRALFVTTSSAWVYVLDASALTVLDSVAVGGLTNGITVNPASTRVYVSRPNNGVVLEIDVQSRSVLRPLPVGGRPQDLAVAADGRLLWVANETGPLLAWDLETNASAGSIPGAPETFGLARSPDDAQLYAGAPAAGEVYVIDTQTRQVVDTIPTGGIPRKIAFGDGGRFAVIANEAGYVTFIH